MSRLLALIVCVSLAVPLAAQQPTLASPPGPRRGLPGEGGEVVPGPQGGPGQPAATPPTSPRSQRLLQTKLDRRPSTILAAWSTPEPKPPEEGADGAASQPSSLPASASQPASAGAAASESAPSSASQPASSGSESAAASGPASRSATASQAALAAQQAAAAAKKAAFEEKKLQHELEVLQRDVALGRWPRVGAFLAALPEKERVPGYEGLLRALHPQLQQQQQQQQNLPAHLVENNTFALADVTALAGIAPGGFDKKQVLLLAPLLRRAIDCGNAQDEVLAQLAAETKKPDAGRVLSPRHGALLLAGIGLEVDMGAFLPAAEQAIADNDREALNLLARHSLARWAKEKKTVDLERAWTVTQAALAAGQIDEKDKAEALRRAVELAPKIRKELGTTWLEESFTKRPERGMEILAAIGGQVARAMTAQSQDASFRQKGLELQKSAVEALLRAAPERAQAWRQTLDLLSSSWITEAAHSYATSTAGSMGPMMRRDPYGNYYYYNQGGGDQRVRPIEPGDLLPLRPEGAWAEMMEPSKKPIFSGVIAQLYLKVNEETKAFPFIDALSRTNPGKAKELANEFLRVWSRNHNPNSDQNRTDMYMYMYGFDQRANGIPLTRSKQERNLAELAVWVEKLRALPIGDLDEQLLVSAFVTSHSTAEVYRVATIEKVFGSLDKFKPKSLAEMAQKMRTNLATVWRRADVQEQKKTRRKQKDIEREVLAGYEVAKTMVARALERHPKHWALMVAQAAIAHDENNYRQEVAKTAEFAGIRKQALAGFATAADRYVEGAGELALEEESVQPFDSWFYAALGACDLGAIDELTSLAPGQTELIRQAIDRLPGESQKRHLAMFANMLFTRMSAAKPHIKYRYLKAGFEIVGDHPQAHEARKVFDYYNDLITEIRLETVVDGPDAVGSGEPFGLRVNLRHTRDIERESGGFAKYLQNQNNAQFSYNYGRPTENYRDKFQEAATQALQEHFEVLSVTFNNEDVHSKATADYGWRVTPYAYLLLKARGPQVDRVPPLRLDLDFLDTSGYAVLPIQSAALPIDASSASPARPFTDLEIHQILDERKADEGKLVLEVKATAKGLVPEFEQLLDLAPADFEVSKRDNPGVSVSRFHEDQETVISERTWNLTLHAKEGLERLPTKFRFATQKLDGAKMVHQRYADADLVTAEPEVVLGERYGKRAFPWLWAGVGAAAAALVVVWLLVRRGSGRRDPAALGLAMPESITAFTVLGLLRDIERKNGFADDAKRALGADIDAIERHFFTRGASTAPDLQRLARAWLDRVG